MLHACRPDPPFDMSPEPISVSSLFFNQSETPLPENPLKMRTAATADSPYASTPISSARA